MLGPRYSILLPTRDGGPFLDRCIRSILGQDHDDFELVVADNVNADATPGILRAHSADPRLRVVRSARLLSVTENWMAALTASTGEYLLMIGDDDLLLPGTVRTLDRLLAGAGDPDCLSFDAFRYVTPGAVAGRPASYYGSPYFGYEPGLVAERSLSSRTRRQLVEEAFGFTFRFPLTMQLTIVKRSALDRLPGPPFRSAFPDHYAICALLLTARTWIVSDRQLLVIGVSPKSFGHYFLNDHDAAGLRYLGLEETFPGALPGNQVLNAQCDWLATTKRDFASHLSGVEIDRGAYVARQVRHWLRQYQHGTIPLRVVFDRCRLLSAADAIATIRRHAGPREVRAVARAASGMRKGRTVYLDRELTPLVDVANIGEFAAWLEARRLTPSHVLRDTPSGESRRR